MKKLIRDKYKEIIKDEDVKLYYIKDITDNEIEKEIIQKTYLFDKLREEVNELGNAKTKEEVAEEICDVMTVLQTIIEYNNINIKRIDVLIEDKKTRFGGFEDFLILEKDDE